MENIFLCYILRVASQSDKYLSLFLLVIYYSGWQLSLFFFLLVIYHYCWQPWIYKKITLFRYMNLSYFYHYIISLPMSYIVILCHRISIYQKKLDILSHSFFYFAFDLQIVFAGFFIEKPTCLELRLLLRCIHCTLPNTNSLSFRRCTRSKTLFWHMTCCLQRRGSHIEYRLVLR